MHKLLTPVSVNPHTMTDTLQVPYLPLGPTPRVASLATYGENDGTQVPLLQALGRKIKWEKETDPGQCSPNNDLLAPGTVDRGQPKEKLGLLLHLALTMRLSSTTQREGLNPGAGGSCCGFLIRF